VEVRESSTTAWFHVSNSHTEKNMEEGRLIPPLERKPQSRPKSSPGGTHDARPVKIGVRRPATASRVSGTRDLHSVRDQNVGASLLIRGEMSREQLGADKKESRESGGKPDTFVHDDGVGTNKVGEGWTEENEPGNNDNAEMAEYGTSFTRMNEQIPYESPPKYCEKQFLLVDHLCSYNYYIALCMLYFP
jgi:hypothetical protein